MVNILRTSFAAIWRNKLTSFLAILGVVIGVTSVSTLVAVGQGLKNDVSSLISGLGTNVIAVIAGKMDTSNSQSMNQSNPADFMSGDILTLNDVAAIEEIPEVATVSPINLVSGEIIFGEKKTAPTIMGAYPELLDAMQVVELERGMMFARGSKERVVVLGYQPSHDLFGDSDPVGQTVQLGKNGSFKVVATLAKSKSSSAFASDINTMVAIPFDTAVEINGGQARIMRIVAAANDDADVKAVKGSVKEVILKSHGGEENFTVMTQDDMLDLFSQFLNMATAMVSAIAAISVVVGGIGIMNIMLVTVTERTREIGIRKAVGATNRAIMVQFLMEALVITLLGGLLGLGVTLLGGIIIAANTPITPAITWSVLVLAIGVSVVVGIVFGLLPAIRASRKDPIESLRYE